MPRLVLRMCRHGRTIMGWVEHQDETLRCLRVAKERLCLYDDGHIAIVSSICPALTGRTLYLRGADMSQDDVLFIYHHASPKAAQATYDAIREAVQTINAEAESAAPDGDPKFERIV